MIDTNRPVVAPSLTPDSYNVISGSCNRNTVVAPSLTPDSYNTSSVATTCVLVVAPSLTPDSYNPDPLNRTPSAGCSSLSHPG